MSKKPSIKLVLSKRSATDKEGFINIRISIPNTNSYKHKSTGHKVAVKFWDAKAERVKPSGPDAGNINADIHNQKNKIETELTQRQLSGQPFTQHYIESIINGSSGVSLIEYFKERIAYISAPRKNDTKKYSPNYIIALNKVLSSLERYSSSIMFADINIKWLQTFEAHYAKTLAGGTSLPTLMSRVRSILISADAVGLFDMKTIGGYKWPSYKNPPRPYLTLAETDRIWKAIEDGSLDGDPSLRTIAAYFLVECYAGIRFSDWGKYEIETLISDRSLKVRATTKTGQPIYLPLTKSPRLSKVVDYIIENHLKFGYTEQFTNRQLKVLRGIVGLNLALTTHVGRHTAATLFLELGYSKETVAEILGISGKTVDIYAKMTRRKIDAEYNLLGGL